MNKALERGAGILLPISSLPSPYGIGTMGRDAYDFVDMLKRAGQKYWQVLPIGPTSFGDSPYQSYSAFAGNPYFISLDELVKEGVLTTAECKKANFGRKADDIDYSRLYTERGRLLRLAYSRSDIGHNEAFTAFCEKNKWWLDDFALFMAVKGRFEGKPWIEWAEDIRLRWQPAMDYYRRELYFEVEYHKYLQFKFDQQWRRLKAYANSKGIRIIGDIPIYVALDSADAWANPGLFQLDKDNIPTAVAGVPPDGFSPTGQLWGNPLYRWEAHRATGYQWWITRLWYCFELYDVVRIDHFRGFDEYFSIPYGSETAAPGHWEKGPGIELFRAVEQALGKREIIAEDLGYMSAITGYYGDKTVAALRDFQDRNGLSPDGMCGEKTFELLYSDDAKESASKAKSARTKANIDKMISVAKKQLGDKYVLGAKGPDKFDCSGLVYYCLKEAGSNRRRLNAAGYSGVDDWTKITKMSDLKRGDLIFFYDNNFTKIGHVGIVLNSSEMIDASNNRGKVVRRDYTESYWRKHFYCGRRPW